jgi:hypothetical protein
MLFRLRKGKEGINQTGLVTTQSDPNAAGDRQSTNTRETCNPLSIDR